MTAIHGFLEPLDRPSIANNEAAAELKADMDEIYADGYAEGRRQGIAEGMSKKASNTSDALSGLQSEIDNLASDLEEIRTTLINRSIETVKSILEGILPELCHRGFVVEVMPLISEVLGRLPKLDVDIAVPGELVEAVRSNISGSVDAAAVHVRQLESEHGSARAQLVWSGGEAIIDLDDLVRNVFAVLDAHIANAQPLK